MGETKASLVRIVLSLYLIHLSQCHMNLDPKGDPVLQRLDIPARETVSEQEFTLEPKIKSADDSASFVRRLWGIPDVTAEVGKEFSLVFPADAFEGHVSRYEVARSDSEALPWWLRFDREKGTLWGKPQPEHVGNWYIKVRAYGAHPHQVATDVFAIQVVNQTCSHLGLSVTFDLDFFTAAPKTRQRLVSALSRHFRVIPADISLKESRRVKPADLVKAGPGNVLLPVNSHLTNAVIRFQCSRVNDTALWSELRKQAANGELADRVGHSITGWFLSKVEAEPGRLRREVSDEGSGDDEDYDYEENHEGDEETDILPETAVVPSQNAPVPEEQPSSTPTVATTPSTTTTTTPAPAEPISPAGPEVEATPVVKLEPSSSVPAIPKEPKIEAEPPQVPPSEEPAPAPTAFPDDYDENEVEGTDEESVKTPHNSPPVVNKRLPRLTVTAGKILRFTVPSDTFTDLEDGSSRSLKLQLVPTESRELADIAWIGFDVQEQTIYGLPLAEDIGRWNFLLRATDKKGESAQEQVEIVVRQHQSERTFNHRFSMQLKPEFSEDEESIPKAQWLLNIVDAIYKTTGDKSGDSVVVRSLAGDFKTDQPFSLSWSNESLSRQHCQEDAIHEILEKFFHSETSEITQEFEDNLPLQFVANAVSVDLEGICKSVPTAATLPPVREIAPVTEKVNEPPQVRNAVDQITAEVGSLLRFQVPEDTFFDPEDGNTRMLRLQLLSSDRQPLDSKLWLQFDAPNQEFYGLPLESDAGSEEYQLRATDTNGLTAHDGLVVFVKPRPKEESFSVEFSLKINVDHESIAFSAHRKARLLETIAEIFGDSDTRNVVVKSLVEGSTIISWSNKSLPVSPCPEAEIRQLRRALLDEDGKLTARAAELLSDADFKPQSATLLPLGACVGELTPTHLPDSAVGEETEAETEKPEGSWTDDYLLTFIVPGIIIAAMLLLAAVIACVLYRRRRTGKLGLEERRSFVSKGIPIIFAEELEERPSSGRHSVKSPVILKDERPAQPPDYRKVRSSASPTPQPRVPAEQRDLLRSPSDETADDEPAAPYQPPPPLAAGSGRDSMKSARPKTTSAYRKPPPYVPP